MVTLGYHNIYKMQPITCIFFLDCYILSVMSDLSTNFHTSTLLFADFDPFSDICQYHFLLDSTPYFLQSSKGTFLLTASCLILYCCFSRPSQPLAVCIAGSSFVWHILNFSDISCLSITCLFQFVLKLGLKQLL